MLEKINNWLENRLRTYADGLVIFSTLATPEIKKKYFEFFNNGKSEKHQHELHFSMLINKVSDIARKVQLYPNLFKDVELVFIKTEVDPALLAAKQEEIDLLKSKIETLKLDNTDLLGENEELSETVNDLESELEDTQEDVSVYEKRLEDLLKEFDALKQKRGVQMVSIPDLPSDLQIIYNRCREITPLMATLHADISVEGLHHKTREKLVKQLTDLDDERRSGWDKIDDWSEGKEVSIEAEKPTYSANLFVAGAQMARRVERLKENISRSQAAADNAERENIKENALKRLEAYKAELDELEKKLAKPVEGSDVE